MRAFFVAALLLLISLPAMSSPIFANGFESSGGGGGPIPPLPVNPCMKTPPGFKVRTLTWAELWRTEKGPQSVYPNKPPFLIAMGSFTLRTTSKKQGEPAAGLVLVVGSTRVGTEVQPITIGAETQMIGWVGAQAVYQDEFGYRYGNPQAADSLTMNISNCTPLPGEKPGNVNPNRFTECAAVAGSANIHYGPGATNPLCRFPEGSKVYITIHFAGGAMDPTENTCSKRNSSDGKYCDGNGKVR